MAGADRAMLAAMGMPAGGVIAVGRTHVLVRPRRDGDASTLTLGPQAMANAGLSAGASVDATRAILPTASRVVVAGDELPETPRVIIQALQGRPVTPGDTITIGSRYLSGSDAVDITIEDVDPHNAGLIGHGSLVLSAADHANSPQTSTAPASAPSDAGEPRAAAALLKGLEQELETLTGWLALLTSPSDLPWTTSSGPKVSSCTISCCGSWQQRIVGGYHRSAALRSVPGQHSPCGRKQGPPSAFARSTILATRRRRSALTRGPIRVARSVEGPQGSARVAAQSSCKNGS